MVHIWNCWERPIVILVGDRSPDVMQEILYVGLSRARNHVILVVPEVYIEDYLQILPSG